MKKKKINPALIIFQLVLLISFAFGVFWVVNNFDAVKAGLKGANLYTIEQIEQARKEEREKFEEEKTFYENYMQNFQGILSQEKEKYNAKVLELETEKSAHNINKDKIENLEDEIENLELYIQSLEGLIENLQNENFDLKNEKEYYKLLLEAYENQDKVIITFYADGMVHAVSILNPGESLNDLPYTPIKEDYVFDKWLLNGQPLTNQSFTQNSDIHASFKQIRTSRLDYEFITNEFGKQGYRITGSSNALIENATLLISEFYDDGINGNYPIIEVGESAFEKSIYKQSPMIYYLNLPAGIEIIGDKAFKGQYLQASHKDFSFKIPSSVKVIGQESFSNIKSLHYITFAQNSALKTIKDRAFMSSMLQELVLPNSVTTIGNEAFYRNEIKEVKLPDQLIEIGVSAFANNKIINLEMNINLITIGGGAFSDNLIENIVIPRWVKIIDIRAFANNKLINVSIGEGVRTIEEQAFIGNQLTIIVVPITVTTLKSNAFDSGVQIIRN